MVIDGFFWFIGAILICGAHALYLHSWRRERRQQLEKWRKYDEASERRHVAFMDAISERSAESPREVTP